MSEKTAYEQEKTNLRNSHTIDYIVELLEECKVLLTAIASK